MPTVPSLVPVSPMFPGPFWGCVPQREVKAVFPSLDFLEIQDAQGLSVVLEGVGSNRGAIPPSPVLFLLLREGFGDHLDQSWVVALGELGIISRACPEGKSCHLPPNLPQNGQGEDELGFFPFSIQVG